MNTKVGRISSVNSANRTARVSLRVAGGSLITSDLKILKTSAEDWLPAVGDSVLCLFLPNGSGDGVVLGGV